MKFNLKILNIKLFKIKDYIKYYYSNILLLNFILWGWKCDLRLNEYHRTEKSKEN